MSGGSDISCLSNLRVPCLLLVGTLLLLMLLGIGSCVACVVAPDDEPSGTTSPSQTT